MDKILYEYIFGSVLVESYGVFIGKELDKITEIRCDLAVVDKMNKREKIQYLDTLPGL